MKNTYKIVVLTNLKDNLKTTIKSAIKLAQTVNGEIEVFNVQKPSEVVREENQLSAVRNIYSKRTAANKKMESLIKPISNEFGISINYSSILGNVKNEIINYINLKQPNMVILGKRKPKLLRLLGDNITGFVIKEYDGEIMIATDENTLEPNKEISIGTLNDTEPFIKTELTEHLLEHTSAALKSFSFTNNTGKVNTALTKVSTKTIDYVFDHNENSLDKLPDYISKNNINLMLINRVKKGRNKKTGLISSDINTIIDRLNVPLVVMGQKNLV